MALTLFLDVDGVLNTRTTCERTPDYHVGIDDLRVKILADVIKKNGPTQIVLSSDWKEMREDEDDYLYLVSKLQKYGLELSGKTKDYWSNRGEGILQYIEAHPEIEEYVILDDRTYDFQDFTKLWERLLLTDGIERARYASKTPAIEARIFLDDIKECSGD